MGFVLVCVFLLFLVPSRSLDPSAFPMWHGFDATWLRRFAGFETSHRLGHFQSEVDRLSTGNSANVTCSLASFSFPPDAHNLFPPVGAGVDGDYAYPRLYYENLDFQDPSIQIDDSRELTFDFTDRCMPDPFGNPVASTLLNQTLDIPIDSSSSSSSVAVLLSGFDLQMWCDPKLQPPGHKCNSNGIWPYSLTFDLARCSYSSHPDVYSCQFVLEIVRGWTPSGGGGRALSQVISYHVKIPFVVLQAPSDRMQSTMGQRLVRLGNTHEPALNGTASFVPDVVASPDSSALPVVVGGLGGFGFRMLETQNRTRLGRYLESLIFRISGMREERKNGEKEKIGGDENILYDYELYYGSAKETTYFANVELWLRPILMRFGEGTVAGGKETSVSCPVCFTADVFVCKLHHLKDDIHCSTKMP